MPLATPSRPRTAVSSDVDRTPKSREVMVIRTYLRLARANDLRPARLTDPRLTFVPIESPTVPQSRRYYEAIGEQWHWHDRNTWTDQRYAEFLARPGLSLWLLRFAGDDAGYVEFQRHADGSVEIGLFGLMPRYVGRGFGKHLLTVAAEEAWDQRPPTVWLHTCTLDSPRALPNYKARGFVPFREERYTTTVRA